MTSTFLSFSTLMDSWMVFVDLRICPVFLMVSIISSLALWISTNNLKNVDIQWCRLRVGRVGLIPPRSLNLSPTEWADYAHPHSSPLYPDLKTLWHLWIIYQAVGGSNNFGYYWLLYGWSSKSQNLCLKTKFKSNFISYSEWCTHEFKEKIKFKKKSDIGRKIQNSVVFLIFLNSDLLPKTSNNS